MAGSAIHRIKEQHACGIVFAPSILPDEINQLLVDLCEVAVRQDLQIQDLYATTLTQKNQLSACQGDIKNMTSQQLTLSNLRSEIGQTWGKISSLEDSHQQLRFSLLQSTKNLDESLHHLSGKLAETETDPPSTRYVGPPVGRRNDVSGYGGEDTRAF
jgi:predicted  nucleic acid-binding Zn-ribbon protein